MVDSDSADTVSESDSELDSESGQPVTAAAGVEDVDGDDNAFVWPDECSDSEAPRTDAEAEASNGTCTV